MGCAAESVEAVERGEGLGRQYVAAIDEPAVGLGPLIHVGGNVVGHEVVGVADHDVVGAQAAQVGDRV